LLSAVPVLPRHLLARFARRQLCPQLFILFLKLARALLACDDLAKVLLRCKEIKA
jgi:hypothetical protein